MSHETQQFECAVDADLKSTEFAPFKLVGGILPVPYCGSSKAKNPHMRAFWAATVTFMLAFMGWFAFAPLLAVVRVDIGICDNQTALVKGKEAKGIVDDLPEDKKVDACICKKSCKKHIGNANIAGVSFDVFTRFILGSVIEAIGPKKTDIALLLWGACVVAASAAVTDATGLIIARFFVSAIGSTFVVNQFWNSIMFSKNVIGTANATAGGWGNLGGGLTQLTMPLFYKMFNKGFGLSLSASWRAAMFIPATVYVITAIWVALSSQDTVHGQFTVADVGRKNKAGFMDYVRVCSDYRVFVMIWQYSACFGCELVMNSTLATHFKDNFGLELVEAGAIALSFGGMNLFARSLGGIASDWADKRYGMCGRLWTHFLSLLGQTIFLFIFGFITKDNGGWGTALFVLIMMSIFVNMAEGTSYGIVPYMIPSQLPLVSAVVGAGGTAGALLALNCFYKPIDTNFTSYKLHAAYVLFWTLSVIPMKYENDGINPAPGSMWSGMQRKEDAKVSEEKKASA